ncbi:MAG: Prespore specific transcriptional activator RsfA [Hydrogenibacillus schlegelii]|uniref:Prespore specific transcriptional activator RsfA n=1 Tax=Hydrogenibacillus schlegelii TaxID=1484 RepID=A0A2T5GF33_HYDSH|nr:hypothetical protein [Hydrogenibacillus schlegelii]PTQ54794.1 MAG: Prespore specific transcriptional activator RsfA [Hydrogenibacillus schlegelii]
MSNERWPLVDGASVPEEGADAARAASAAERSGAKERPDAAESEARSSAALTAEGRFRRYDSWKDEEDRLLASLVLDYVRSGRTQLEAFVEAAGRLGRTASACGFRWNKALRTFYREELEAAKKERRERRKGRSAARAALARRTEFQPKLSVLLAMVHDLERSVRRLKEEVYRIQTQWEAAALAPEVAEDAAGGVRGTSGEAPAAGGSKARPEEAGEAEDRAPER